MHEFRKYPLHGIKNLENILSFENMFSTVLTNDRMFLCSEQVKPHQLVWYDKVLNSSEILPPKKQSYEVIFPHEIEEYLDQVAIPVYKKYHRFGTRLSHHSYI